MVDTGELGEYLNAETAKQGDIIEILGEGKIEEIPQKDGTTRRGLNLPVIINGKLKVIYSPGRTVMKEYKKLWGLDTKAWVGKKCTVSFLKMQQYGELKDILYLTEIKATQVK